MKAKREPLMVRVWAELGAGRMTEAFIHDPGYQTDGYTDDGSKHITVNPAWQTVDTVIHEILHRLQPSWSENYVRRTTTYLRRRMTDEEVRTFYDEYQKRVYKRKRAVRLDT